MVRKPCSSFASWYLGILEVSGKKSGRKVAEPAWQVLDKQRKSNKAPGLGLPSSKKLLVVAQRWESPKPKELPGGPHAAGPRTLTKDRRSIAAQGVSWVQWLWTLWGGGIVTWTDHTAGWTSDNCSCSAVPSPSSQSSRLHPTGAENGVGSPLHCRMWVGLWAWFWFSSFVEGTTINPLKWKWKERKPFPWPHGPPRPHRILLFRRILHYIVQIILLEKVGECLSQICMYTGQL